jgi:hypothetical protein
MTGLRTGTVTLPPADVEGSTRLWETQRDEIPVDDQQLNKGVAPGRCISRFPLLRWEYSRHGCAYREDSSGVGRRRRSLVVMALRGSIAQRSRGEVADLIAAVRVEASGARGDNQAKLAGYRLWRRAILVGFGLRWRG